jgi:hypothetical protein
MDLFVTDIDALRMLRIGRTSASLRLLSSDVRDVSSHPSRRVDESLLGTLEDLGLGSFSADRPLHLWVPGKGQRIHCLAVRSHVHAAFLPEGSFLQLAPSTASHARSFPDELRIFVDAPSLCLSQLSVGFSRLVRLGRLSEQTALVRLAATGMELVGSYARDPSDPLNGPCTYGVAPMCSVDKLAERLHALDGVRGRKMATRVSRWLSSGSASPAETTLDLSLTLPVSLGGLLVRHALLNEPLRFTDHQLSLMAHSSMRPDLYWPEWRLALEYNGRKFHEGSASLAEDAARVQDYQTCGITVFPVTSANLRNVTALEALALRIGQATLPFEGRAERDRIRRAISDDKAHAARILMLAELQR